MILLRLALMISLLAPLTARGQSEFPNPPTGQVLDAGHWLGDERRSRLEEELGRFRAQYEIDIQVIIWDRSIPSHTSLEELAHRIGETWGREELWSVILHVPDSLHHPAVVSGGLVTERIKDGVANEAVQRGIVRGMKERTTRDQVQAVALEVGEEFVFLKHRRALEQKALIAARDKVTRDKEARSQRMLVQAAIVTLLALISVGLLGILYFLKRRSAELIFPETRWRRRLGAEWSGGAHIVVSLPTES